MPGNRGPSTHDVAQTHERPTQPRFTSPALSWSATTSSSMTRRASLLEPAVDVSLGSRTQTATPLPSKPRSATAKSVAALRREAAACPPSSFERRQVRVCHLGSLSVVGSAALGRWCSPCWLRWRGQGMSTDPSALAPAHTLLRGICEGDPQTEIREPALMPWLEGQLRDGEPGHAQPRPAPPLAHRPMRLRARPECGTGVCRGASHAERVPASPSPPPPRGAQPPRVSGLSG